MTLGVEDDFDKQRYFLRNILITGDITSLRELVFVKTHIESFKLW